MRKIKIVGTGTYLPRKKITAQELAEKLGVTEDEIIKSSGVKCRYQISEGETASIMGAKAALAALADAKLELKDIDLILCASGTMQMPIPCTAALIHKELRLTGVSIPAYDINSTCLSFLTALDTISYQMDKYRNILIISSEISSVGLNLEDIKTASLFGDGAAAVVISRAENSGIIASNMITYSEGWNYCTIEGGGTGCTATHYTPQNKKQFQFQMNGKELFRLASKQLPEFVENLLNSCGLKMQDIDLVVPHQASLSAINIIQKKLKIETSKLVNIVESFGNVIAASIPMALHEAIKTNRVERGSKVMLLGTSAGISIGGMILEY